VKHYLWDADRLGIYFETRNGMIGADYSSKFSPWLAHGCLSPRFIHAEVQRYEKERVANKSTYWLIFELIWRDFFKFFCLKHGNAVFQLGGTADKHWQWEGEGEAFERWRDGETGQPLVDANMRELKLTGFMSNRGRQNVASFLTQNLNVDWRLGAAYFEEALIDHDVTANWGNWMFAAGLSGGRVNKFNILKQSKDYDEQGDYCRLWFVRPAVRVGVDVVWDRRLCANVRDLCVHAYTTVHKLLWTQSGSRFPRSLPPSLPRAQVPGVDQCTSTQSSHPVAALPERAVRLQGEPGRGSGRGRYQRGSGRGRYHNSTSTITARVPGDVEAFVRCIRHQYEPIPC
jgi:hypothetical protein